MIVVVKVAEASELASSYLKVTALEPKIMFCKLRRIELRPHMLRKQKKMQNTNKRGIEPRITSVKKEDTTTP